MPQETEFLDYITDHDRIRVRFTTERGVPERIMVQLECEVDGRWRAARRYDNAHGDVHVHATPWDPARDRRPRVAVGDLRHAVRVLTAELVANWQMIRAGLVGDLRARQHDA